MHAGYPGALIQFIPLTPEEIPQCAVPEDEASATHHRNPHLVARVVDWKTHDLQFKEVFQQYAVGRPGSTTSLSARINAGKAAYLDHKSFENNYQKTWYHLLRGIHDIVADPATDADEFHTWALQCIGRMNRMDAARWQSSVSRMLLAYRGISLMHDQSIGGRLFMYSEQKQQNSYLPLNIGNY